MDPAHESIERGLIALGVAPVPAMVALLAQHLELVIEANRVMSLTSIDPADAVALHILDSVAALPFLTKAPDGSFADLGSGPGYPGIPLSVLSGRPVALVESVRKKAAFLERVVADLRLKATVHSIRAEELAQEHDTSFAAVTARALSSLPCLVELAAPLLALDGLLVCLKGRRDEEEIRRGDAAARLCGLVLEEATAVTVPGVVAARTIITYRRVRAPSLDLPRRTGLAQRKPLA